MGPACSNCSDINQIPVHLLPHLKWRTILSFTTGSKSSWLVLSSYAPPHPLRPEVHVVMNTAVIMTMTELLPASARRALCSTPCLNLDHPLTQPPPHAPFCFSGKLVGSCRLSFKYLPY